MDKSATDELSNMPSNIVTDIDDIPDQTTEPDFGD